jgi:hypothetical protein
VSGDDEQNQSLPVTLEVRKMWVKSGHSARALDDAERALRPAAGEAKDEQHDGEG